MHARRPIQNYLLFVSLLVYFTVHEGLVISIYEKDSQLLGFPYVCQP